MIRLQKYKTLILLFVLFTLSNIFVSSVFSSSQQTSSTTAQSIINDARAYLNESTAAFWDDTDLLQWLNDGMVDIVTTTHCLQTTESVTLIASTIEYSLTSTYTTVKAVQYIDSNSKVWALKRGSPEHVGSDAISRQDLTIPSYWYEWAGKIGIYPALSSVTTETVTVYLITRPTAITISSDVTTPAIYDKALTLYIVAQALWRDRQTARSGQIMGLYSQELARARGDLNEILNLQKVDKE